MSSDQALRALLDQNRGGVRVLEHPPCRTSLESAAARAAAGAPEAIGAKALVVTTKAAFAMLVLPGSRRLDSKRVRDILGKFRFATPDEVREATGGLEIGTIPPFGQPVFPGIETLAVDFRIAESEWIGFNAACLVRSVVMTGGAYLALAKPDYVADISLPGEDEHRGD